MGNADLLVARQLKKLLTVVLVYGRGNRQRGGGAKRAQTAARFEMSERVNINQILAH